MKPLRIIVCIKMILYKNFVGWFCARFDESLANFRKIGVIKLCNCVTCVITE